jgi:uncharacterized protein (TIGR03086 family)
VIARQNGGMELLESFDRAAAVATAVVAGIDGPQYDLPSPCEGWTARDVLNHLLRGNESTQAAVRGEPRPDPSGDRVGPDPAASLAASIARTREALHTPGLADLLVRTPFGQRPGTMLVNIRTVEHFVHAWDLAVATGQLTDLDPELAEHVLSGWAPAMAGIPRETSPFGTPEPVAADACAADRLAAFLGRTVSR